MNTENKKISPILLMSFLCSSVLSLVVHFIINMRSYRGLEQKQADFLESIAGVIWLLFLTICSVTVYFNRIKTVRDSVILSLLSFILLPAIAIGAFWYMNRSTRRGDDK